MTVTDIIKGRRSIRQFLDKEIPKELIREILDEARWSPSWGNTQSWNFHVLTGEALKNFKEANHAALLEELESTPDIPMPESWPDACRLRYNDMGRRLYDSLGIERRDTEARRKLRLKMTHLFQAPCMIVPTIHRENAIEYGLLDMGLIIQTICLLAHEKGLGTLIMAAAVQYPDIIRKIASIPAERKIIAGIALGYPDWDCELNQFERSRASVDEYVQWVE
ncbi:MAG: nitroreductase [Syntrophobacterales bacterium]|jgi:nitroreductase|nr:nitroreductase [Syntrophobacterales bacterium]